MLLPPPLGREGEEMPRERGLWTHVGESTPNLSSSEEQNVLGTPGYLPLGAPNLELSLKEAEGNPNFRLARAACLLLGVEGDLEYTALARARDSEDEEESFSHSSSSVPTTKEGCPLDAVGIGLLGALSPYEEG